MQANEAAKVHDRAAIALDRMDQLNYDAKMYSTSEMKKLKDMTLNQVVAFCRQRDWSPKKARPSHAHQKKKAPSKSRVLKPSASRVVKIR